MEFTKRKSPRIPNYDYSTANFYFLTVCTHEKRCIFGKPGNLNWMGKIAEENLLKIPVVFPNIRVDHYVVMPNHVHMILDVQNSGETDISVVMGQYKMSVTRKIRERIPDFPVWQRSFHDHVIRNQARYEQVWRYIEGNPMRWEDDCFYMGAEETERFREGQ